MIDINFSHHWFLLNEVSVVFFRQNQPSNIIASVRPIEKNPSAEEPDDFESEPEKPVSEYDEVSSTRPWYFTNGERYPKPARINKKTKKRLAKLIPSEDVRGDRITNQLMFVPPNYEEIKNEGRLKTILLYNGLGPWNVKQGEVSKFRLSEM